MGAPVVTCHPHGTVCSSVPVSYAVCLDSISIASKCPSSCTHYHIRVVFYNGNCRAMYGHVWASPRQPMAGAVTGAAASVVVKLDWEICFHTCVVDPACKLLVELVLDTGGSDPVSASFALLPVFGTKLKTYGSADVTETPVYAGTPRFLLYSAAPTSAAGGRLTASVATHMGLLSHATRRYRENEIFSLLGALPTLSTPGCNASNTTPTCTVTLDALRFCIPASPGDGSGSVSQKINSSFEEAMLHCLNSVTENDAWLNSNGIEAAHAYCGIHNGYQYLSPRLHVGLRKFANDLGGSTFTGEAPVSMFEVPMSAGTNIVISLYATVESGAETASALIGWVCVPYQNSMTPQAVTCNAPLNRGPEPAPCGGSVLSWALGSSSGEVVDVSWTVEVGAAGLPATTAIPGPTDAKQAAVMRADGNAATAGIVATAPLADAELQALLHEQQLQIASLKQQLDTRQQGAETSPQSKHPTPDKEVHSAPGHCVSEAATTTASAPWKLEQYDAMRTEVKRLSEELARRSAFEDELKTKMQLAEGNNQQLQRDLAAQERSLDVEKTAAAASDLGSQAGTETTRDQMLQLVENELGDYRVTPVQTVARAARAEIMDADVPDIIDISRSDTSSGGIAEPVDLALEENDALQESEVVLHATGLIPAANWTTARMYFVVQFYHFEPAVTEVVTLHPVSEGHELGQEGVAHQFAMSDSHADQDGQTSGVKLTFTVKARPGYDNVAHAPPESRRLASYFCSGALHLEAWDADTLLPLGSLKASLAGLLRQGRPSVQSNVELDLRSLNFSSANGSGNICATLQLSICNHGKMSRSAADSLLQAVREEGNVTIGPVVSGVVPKATLQGRARHRQRATLFVSNELNDKESSNAHVSAISEGERKLARLRRLAAARAVQDKELGATNAVERWEQLQMMDREREQTRNSRIAKSLHSSITRKLRLPTRFGEVGFFEFAFENPFPTNLAFDLCFDNGQLSIVTDAEEWAHHKTKHNLSSPLERNFMSPGGKQVYLNAREVIYIPFAVRSNNWSYTREAVEGDVDKTIPEGVPGIQALKPGNHLHEIALTVRAATTDQVVAVLQIELVPQPFVVDARLHFHAAKGELMNARIPVSQYMCPAWRSDRDGTARQWYIHCTEQNAVVGVTRTGLQHALTGPAVTTAQTFFVVLYHDRFHSSPAGIWQIVVHSYEPHEIRAILGQTNEALLAAKPSADTIAKSDLICHSSQPNVLRLQKGAPVVLEPGRLSEIQMSLRPTATGRSSWLVNLIDPSQPICSRLLHRWLVTAVVPLPVVSRSYEATLVSSGEKKMRILYTNPYSKTQTFLLRSDQPGLVVFEVDRLEIPAGEGRHMYLRFQSQPGGTAKTLYIFINDAADRVVEAIRVDTRYH